MKILKRAGTVVLSVILWAIILIAGAVCVHDDGDEGQSERCKYIWLYAADGTVGFHGTDVCFGRSDFYQKM